MTTDRERWLRLSHLFDRAIDLDIAARNAFLDAECAGDADLRDELQRMLDADAESSAFDAGAAGVIALDDASPHDEDASGEQLGAWQLQSRLGSGGTGTVYVAHRQDDTAQRAAIKRLQRRWDGSAHAQRFLQERRILAALSHANIPALLDHGVDDEGRPWFALEFVDGDTLTAWADARQLNPRERIALFLHVCAAVQHAHERFVVHRDLKPANILVDADGRARVLDFGVAKRLDTEGSTRTGVFAGFTPEYAAPEQISNGPVSAATDVYALGVVLYELLSGQLPYRFDHADLRGAAEAITGHTAGRLDRALVTGDANDVQARIERRRTSVLAFRRFVRGDLTRIVQTALAKEPERRYASVQAFATDLQYFLEGRPVSVTGDTFGYRARKFVQRNRWGVAMTALAAIAIVTGVTGTLLKANEARREAALAIQVKDYLIDMFRQADRLANTDQREAQSMLDNTAQRLERLPPDSQMRHELLAVLLHLYNERAYRQAGIRLAQREVSDTPRWRGDGSDLARLRSLTTALQLRKDDGHPLAVTPVMLRALEDFPEKQSVEYAQALILLGEAAGDVGRSIESEKWHAQADAILRRAVPPGDDRLVGNSVLLAGAMTSQRRLRQARALTERALADTPADADLRAYVCTMAALRRAVFGEFSAAAPLFEETRRIRQKAGESRLSHYYLLTRTTNLFALGQLDQADAELAQGLKNPAQRSYNIAGDGMGDLLWLRGETALARHDANAAAGYLEEAVRLQRTASDNGRNALYIRSLHAIALAQAGRDNDARQVLTSAAGLGGTPPVPSYANAMFRAAQGITALHAGDARTAMVALQDALDQLEQARRLPADVHNQLRENRDAVRLRLWLAHAQQAASDPMAATTLSQAQQLADTTLGPAHPFTRMARASL